MPDECIRILENMVQQEETAMKQAQPLGQMAQARARFRRVVESGEGLVVVCRCCSGGLIGGRCEREEDL